MRGRPASYLSLTAEGWAGKVALLLCYLRAGLARTLHSHGYTTPGQYLHRPVVVSSGGMRLALRPHTDDLNYALPDHKPSMNRWFTPSSGDRVVDVGAHNGFFAIRAAKAGASVLAFEPNPGLAETLETNLRLNAVRGVRLRRTALGPGYGHGTLRIPSVGEGFARVEGAPALSPPGAPPAPAGREIEVAVEPLDGVLRELGEAGPIDWLLIDAEGSEALILAGAPRALARTDRVILEVIRGETSDACRAMLARSGLMVVARERQSERTEYWSARRDPEPFRLPDLLPHIAG